MKDPYEVLGVTKDASDDEIKAAYRELAKKYHPDKYIDNPLADLAAEKMKEINEAYDKIVNSRKRKGSAKDSSGTYNTSSNPVYARIRSLINNNLLDDAQRELDEIDLNIRDAEWYFLSGSVLYKRGHFSNAYSAFATAVNLEPDNAEYRRALNMVQRYGKGEYGSPYRSYGGGQSACASCGPCDICQGLLCADCCCECFGGDIIPCC
jgi:curved DNA-binding protein CbpA